MKATKKKAEKREASTVEEERDATAIALLKELRRRAKELKPMELVGAARTVLQERTAAKSLSDEDSAAGSEPEAGPPSRAPAPRRATPK